MINKNFIDILRKKIWSIIRDSGWEYDIVEYTKTISEDGSIIYIIKFSDLSMVKIKLSEKKQ